MQLLGDVGHGGISVLGILDHFGWGMGVLGYPCFSGMSRYQDLGYLGLMSCDIRERRVDSSVLLFLLLLLVKM